jgi:hypothetical protein
VAQARLHLIILEAAAVALVDTLPHLIQRLLDQKP